MTELFFPSSSSQRTFIKDRGAKDRDSTITPEERLLGEMREMRKQIQLTFSEEITNQSQRMLQEIKREVNRAVEHSRGPPTSPHEDVFVLPLRPHRSEGQNDPSLRQAAAGGLRACSSEDVGKPRALQLGKKFMRIDKARVQSFMPSFDAGIASPEVSSDPRCPLAAHGDAPPLLHVETDDGVPHGKVEKGAGGHRRTVSIDDHVEIDTISEVSVDHVPSSCRPDRHARKYGSSWSQSTYSREGMAAKGRLSLTVDACRKKEMIQSQRSLRTMSAKDFLNSTKFDNAIGALILLNAVAIGIQTDYAAKNVTEDFPGEFHTIERIFLFCFSLELFLRIYVQRSRFFCWDTKGFVWNYFDTCIVFAQIFEEVLLLIADNVGVNTDMFTVLRILRVLRIVRILRVVRVLHLISELRTIVSSILGSLKSLGWTVVLLLLVIYIVGVYFTQAITDHLVEVRLGNSTETKQDRDLQYYFGSLPRTILSLWQSMSGGADWDALASPLMSQVGMVTGILFAAFIAFALLALMNVVTGVFVQTALQSAKDEEDAFLVDQVLKLFDKTADKDADTITLDQIEEKFSNPAVAREWKSINVQPAEAKYLFSLLDIEETGEISFQEFLSGCLRLHGHSKSMDLLTVMQEARAMSRRQDNSWKRWETYQYNLDSTLEGLSHALAASSSVVSRLSSSVDSAVDVANQNQDKIGRLEKRIRSFESSLSSVRIATSNISKVNEIIDTVISPSPSMGHDTSIGAGGRSNNRALSENSDAASGHAFTPFAHLCTIDEV